MLLLLQQNIGFAWGSVALVEVPDVVGQTEANGTTALEAEGFVVVVETAYSDSVAVGLVISQDPVGGSFASSGATVTITVSLGPARDSGAGKSKRKRYFVHIDGQDFEVRSPEQAREVLQKAVALAEKAAERQAKPKVVKSKVLPVTPVIPEIRTNAPIDLEPYQKAIEAAYRNVAIIAEMRALLEAQAREEDDLAAMLLLQ